MLRFIAFSLLTITFLGVCRLDPCFAQPTPTPPVTNPIINPPYDGSGFAKMWTYRTGTDNSSRALAFRIEGTSGQNLQGKLSMYKVKDIEGGKYFEKKKIRINGTNIDAFTIDCILEVGPKKGYIIKAQRSQGDPVEIGLLSTTPNGMFVLIRWHKDNVVVEGDTLPIRNPCDEPPEIGEEEEVTIGVDSLTPGPTLSITPRPKTAVAATSTTTQPN